MKSFPRRHAFIGSLFALWAMACTPSTAPEERAQGEKPTEQSAQEAVENAQDTAKSAQEAAKNAQGAAKSAQGAAENAQGAAKSAPQAAGSGAITCPMAVPGTQPKTVRLEGVAAIDFFTDQTEPENVALLRAQVKDKIGVHQRGHKRPEEIPPLNEEALAALPEPVQQIHRKRWQHRRLISTATVTGAEIPHGWRVELRPADPTEYEALYQEVDFVTQQLIKFGPRCPDNDHH